MSHYIDNEVVEGLLTHKGWNTNTLITTVAAATQTLTNASETTQIYQGTTSGQIVKMPDCTTFTQIGQRYELHNDSTQNVTVQDSAAAALFLLAAGQRVFLVCTSIASAAGSWSYIVTTKTPAVDQLLVTYLGSGLVVNYTAGNARFNNITTLIPAGTITVPANTTNGWIYVDTDGVVKATASLPNGAMAMSLFTSVAASVTSTTDEREVVDQNTVWGLVGDIQPERYNSAAAAGTLEKAARADHVHASNNPLYKAGQILAATFTGNPKTAAVTFGTVFPAATYNVTVTGTDGRSWVATSLLASGFTISSQANQALTGPVYWTAIFTGESQ